MITGGSIGRGSESSVWSNPNLYIITLEKNTTLQLLSIDLSGEKK